MRILKKRNILKLAATFVLVGMMAGAFAMHGSAALAIGSTCPAGTYYNTTGGCSWDTTSNAPGLQFTNIAPLVIPNITPGIRNDFTFASTVLDERGATAGWQLQAISPGFVSNVVTTPTPPSIPLEIGTSASSTPAGGVSSSSGVPSTGGTCPTVSFTPIPLPDATESTAQTFASADNTGVTGAYTGCTFTLTTGGSFTLPTDNTYPVGAYTATITLSILATA